METINHARICVNTQRRIAQRLSHGKWFPLSDFSDRTEFLTACYTHYIREKTPELFFSQWENIPKGLVTPDTLLENFFLLREAMEELDESEYNHFIRWCHDRKYLFSEEDPYLLVSRYQEQVPFSLPEDDILPDERKIHNLSGIPNEEEDYNPSYYGIWRIYTPHGGIN